MPMLGCCWFMTHKGGSTRGVLAANPVNDELTRGAGYAGVRSPEFAALRGGLAADRDTSDDTITGMARASRRVFSLAHWRGCNPHSECTL